MLFSTFEHFGYPRSDYIQGLQATYQGEFEVCLATVLLMTLMGLRELGHEGCPLENMLGQWLPHQP